MEPVLTALLIYWAIISAVSVLTAALDKAAARRHAWRVPEKTLMLLGALGGAAAMLLTMLLIRHKTRHLKFMLGLPLLILLHGAALALILYAIG